MFAKTQILVAVFAASVVVAQSTTDSGAPPTSTDGISPCILTCVTQAGASSGCSFTDSCVCTSTAFQTAAEQCLQSTCTPAEVQQALQLQQSQCGDTTPSGSGSATTEAAPTGSGNTTDTAAAPTTTATSGTTTPTGTTSGTGSTSKPSAPSSTGPSNTSQSAPASTSNAAVSSTHVVGWAGALVAGFLGLVL